MSNRRASTPPSKPAIFFINRFAYPDQSATARLLHEVAAGLAADGFDVRVLASRRDYSDAKALRPRLDRADGVRIVRLDGGGAGNGGLAARAFDAFRFHIAASAAALRQVRRGDVLVCLTDPPLLGAPMAAVAGVKRARLVNWLQDLYPEAAAEMGVPAAAGVVGFALKAIRNVALQTSAANIVIGERMAAHVERAGAPAGRIRLLANFADENAIHPLPRGASSLRQAWGFDAGDVVLGYCGNLGRAHDIETILAAAEALRDWPQVKFLFVGGGRLRSRLEAEAAARGLRGMMFRPYQPEDRLSEVLAVPDLHWASLRPSLEGLIVPSKAYGVAAAGRGLIMVGDPAGEIAALAARHGFGEAVRAGDGPGLAALLRALALDPARVDAMGAAGRRFAETTGSKEAALDAWRRLIREIASTSAAARPSPRHTRR